MAEKETKSCSKGCEEMTDNEVIKALEVCAYSDDCLKECPFFNYNADCTKRLTASVLEIIKRYQSDVAPVKHGHFRRLTFSGDTIICSECKMAYNIFETNGAENFNFCPHCGAKIMDGGDDE